MDKLKVPMFGRDLDINKREILPFEAGFPQAARLRINPLFAILGLAVVLRLSGIALYPMVGDEYGTILEAKSVGLNWNSILYSTLMHFWVQFGTSEFWLRLPAAIFGIATVAVLFKIGVKLGGWRAGITAALLAATSPFNIYHSQEVRFYSLFMLTASVFMLATISYLDSKSARGKLWVVLSGAVLVVSHFLGAIALYAQGVAAFLEAKKRRLLTVLAVTCGPAVLIFGVPILPPVRHQLLQLYAAFGNAPNADLTTTSLSSISLIKAAFAGYVFMFGYHVYPLRLLLVIPGLALCSLFLVRGVLRLSRERRWVALPFLCLAAIVGVYFVLDSLGGRVAHGVAPRHTSFVWPAFLVLLALGLSSFKRKSFQVLLTAMLIINAGSLVLGWQKDWTYGVATDHRAAGAYISSWADKETALILDGRSTEPAAYYFPQSVPRATSQPGSAEFNQFSYRRLILTTNDWRAPARQISNEWLTYLANDFAVIDGRVEYPLFQYVLKRKSGFGSNNPAGETAQLSQPVSIYGIEFQDLNLPVSVNVSNVSLKVTGAYGLPNSAGDTEIMIPVSRPMRANKLILVTNVVGLTQSHNGMPIAEVTVEGQSGSVQKFPLRLNEETASWRDSCSPSATCRTVFQWHKRIAITGEHRFPDAWRDFQAGMHGSSFNLPDGSQVKKVSIRYLAQSGNLYLWGIALSS